MTDFNQLELLCRDLAGYKSVEDDAKAKRVETEAQIAAMLTTKTEGADKAVTENFKVTVTNKLTRSLDYEAYQGIKDSLPAAVQCVDLKPSLNMKKLRMIEALDPGLVAQFITVKPAKPAVKLEVM